MNRSTFNGSSFNGLGGTLNQASADLGCSIVVSDYKWLSPALKTKQQSFAVRPYYSCQIIDDSFVPNQVLSDPSYPRQGSSVVAPDGITLTVGIDSTNSVSIWIGTPLTTYGSPSHVFASGASVIDSRNHVAVQVSDYIAGKYKIDVYFFGNMDNSGGTGFLSIKHYYSLDSGATWATAQAVNDTIIPYANTQHLWISAGKPYQADNGNIISTVFYIEPDGTAFDITYQQYLGTGGAYHSAVRWSKKDINTRDWMLHSLDVALIDSKWHVAFSGYHSYYEPTNQDASILNYGIYTTEILNFQNDETLDVWSPANPVITAVSSSPQNKNSFTWPQLMYDDADEILYLIFRGQTVFSISDVSSNSSVTINDNFYISKSVDLSNFIYPNPIIFTDGTEFSDTNSNSIVRTGQLFYILGNGKLWNYILNNTVADVSPDILQYQVKDTQQSPSTMGLSIGNQNNQWRGASPTQPGYQAIAKNKKINLFQGYYTGDSTTEVAPKNVFYIDDIQATVTTSRNDFILSGRDFYKLLKVLQTKFAFNYTGIKKYVDIFDGTTMSNYNISSGTWSENPATNTLNQSNSSAIESLAIFSSYQQTKANTIFTVSAQLPDPSLSGSAVRFYFYYVDSGNYMTFDVANNTSSATYDWSIRKTVSGVPTTLQSGSFAVGTTNFFPFMFVRQSFGKCQIYRGSDVSSGQAIGAFNTMSAIGTEVDFTLNFTDIGTVAFGGFNTQLSFKNFRYTEFDISQNIKELIRTIATKSGVFDYKMPTVFQDRFFNNTNYSGSYSLQNRTLYVPQSQTVMKNDIQLDNIDVEFEGQLSILNASSASYFDFIFRNTGLANNDNNYFVRVRNDGTGYITVSLYATYLGVQYLLASTGGSSSANNLRFDLSQSHKYRILFFNSYIYVIIDDEVVFGWFDNNITNMQSTGYIGFRSSSNNVTLVRNVIGIDLWTQIENFAINPGDDLESSIESLLNTIRSYFFSDNWGRMKVVVLRSADSSNYTYQDQLVLQAVDNSDKEYYNQITVVGQNGITATARDGASISQNGIIRDYVVNDNKITNYNDALARAQAELINANKFNNQYNPKQINNLGSEIYDVVRVINTGANSSNVDQVVRNYAQEADAGGNNQSYWISIETGKL